VRSVEKVAGALKWEKAAPVVEIVAAPQPPDVSAARDLGATVAMVTLERMA
jgi:hypothetical protein